MLVGSNIWIHRAMCRGEDLIQVVGVDRVVYHLTGHRPIKRKAKYGTCEFGVDEPVLPHMQFPDADAGRLAREFVMRRVSGGSI
jgi:hypothetical protein